MDLEYDKRARGSIAGGALTNSKRPSSFVRGVYPTHLIHGLGAYVTDTNHKKYIDFICGLGTNLYGYNHHALFDRAVTAEKMGATLSLSTVKEIELAELIKTNFHVESMRFVKTGTEGCMAAVTIARAYTKRNTVLSDGYHGWSSEFVSLTPPAHGCPDSKENIRKLDLNDIEVKWDNVAAVIIEPVITDYSQKRKEHLQSLRDKCTKHGVVLIFDETITAFRFPQLTVAKYFGIEPDLIVFGKALGGGSALSCVAGKQTIMNCDYFVSGTFAGELGPILKAQKVIELAKTTHTTDKLWNYAENFWVDFNKETEGFVRFDGYPTRGVLTGEDLPKALFMQEMCKAGILIGPSPFFMWPHIELRDQILSTVRDIVLKLKCNMVKLEGDLPLKPYAQRLRENKTS